MKLEIRKQRQTILKEGEYCRLTTEQGGEIATIHKSIHLEGYDFEFYARLFQSAEELLEFAEDYNNADKGTDLWFIKKWDGTLKLKELCAYVKTGDKDDMVTVKYDGNEIKMKKRSIRKLRDALDNSLK